MRKYATADCETDPFKYGRIPKPFIWGIFDRSNGFRYFYDTEEFIGYIRNYGGIIYFHNGGKFDIHLLLEFVDDQDDVMIINGRIAKIKIGDSEIRDSFLLLPVPLSAYKKDEIDYEIMEENKRWLPENKKSICDYLEGDCVYLYEILEAQFAEYGQKLTLATSAFDFWHKNFSNLKLKPKSSKFFFQAFKPYYYGGRVECFQKGIIEKEFQVYDINSAYPYAMLSEHPFGTECSITKTLPDGDTMQRCFIRFKGLSQGALPFRDISGQWAGKNTLNFFNDNIEREYFATGWELQTGIELGKIKINKIEKVTKFHNSINFADYANYFFKQKAELKGKDEARYLLAKLYLNSLYGKFGQSSEDHKDYSLIDKSHIQGYLNEGYTYEGEMGKWALVSCPIEETKQKFYNVATAASVTGFVRAYLYKHVINCDSPIYCDTDSLACNGFRGELGKELGQWENEGSFIRGAIGGKKLYAFEREKPEKGNKFKISSKGAKLTAKEIFAIANGETVLYKNDAPTFSVAKETKFVTRNIKMT